MRKLIALWGTLIASATISMAMFLAPAQAQATRTWVSGVGDDANPCSRTAPCKTFAGSISKTAAGGEINCLDSGGFGAVTITKAISIICTGLEAGVLVSGTNGIVVSAQPTDVVRLIGLDIVGLGTGIDGVQFNSGAALVIKDCKIYQFTKAGVRFAPNNSGAVPATLEVTDTSIWDNGNTSGSGAGILIRPSQGGAKAVIHRVVVDRTAFPLWVEGTAAIASAAVDDSVFGNSLSGPGITAISSGNAAVVNVMRSVIYGNVTGFQSTGAGAILRIGESQINQNATAVSIVSPAIATSYGSNQFNDNAAPGTALPISGTN
jgi:hypothetical protein